MRLAHGRTGWALLAAGGMALTAAAQVTPPAPQWPDEVKAGVAAGPQAGTDQVQVELAWLADPATFPCQLAARVTGDSLEVGGMVPSEGLRQKAVEVAKKHTMLSVVDKLIVRPGSALPVARANQDSLCRSATGALTGIFTKLAETFEVAADPSGQVTVSGCVPTPEEKLNVSRRLSMLNGCSSVVNKITIKQAPQTASAPKVDVVAKVEPPPPVAAPPDRVEQQTILPPPPTRVEQQTILPPPPTQAMAQPVIIQSVPAQPVSMPSQPVPVQAKTQSASPSPSQSVPAQPAPKPQGNLLQPPQVNPIRAISLETPATQPRPMLLPANAPVVSMIDPTLPKTSPQQPLTLPQTAKAVPAGQPAFAARPAVQAKATAPVAAPAPIAQAKAVAPAPVIVNQKPAEPVSPYARSSKPVQTGAASDALVVGPRVPQAQPITQASHQAGLGQHGITQAAFKTDARNGSTIVQASKPASPYGGAARSNPTPVTTTPSRPETIPAAAGKPLDQYRPSAPGQQAPVRPVTPTTNPIAPGPLAPVVIQNSPAMPKAQPSSFAPAGPIAAKPTLAVTPAPIVPASPMIQPVTATQKATPVNPIALQGQLQQRIQAACGNATSDIQVVKQGENHFLVRLRVRNAADGDRVAQKVLELPELAPYQVDLEVRQGQ